MRHDDDTDEFPPIGATMALSPLQAELEAKYTELCQRAKNAGIWDWFWRRVYEISKSFGPIVIPTPTSPAPVPPGGYPIPLMSRDPEGERAD
jgi:hypothetical protein